MGAIASLDRQLVAVTPGEEASLEVKIRNNGSVVDELTVSVLGPAGDWAAAEPPTLSLFPGAEGTTTVHFRPPRDSSIAAGQMAFGVRVASGEDPSGSTVEEGDLEIGPFTEIGAELSPLTSRGSRGGKHDLKVDNRGNVALNANIVGIDDSEQVRFEIQPPSVTPDAGAATFAEVEVKPARRMWRGRPQTRNFAIQVEAPGQSPVSMKGTFLQEALIPGWLIKGLLGLAALLVALLVLWFFVLQPTVLTTAEERAAEVAEERAAEVAQETAQEETKKALEEAGIEPGATNEPTASPTIEPTASPTIEPTASPSPDLTSPPTPTPGPTPVPTPATLLPEGDPIAGRVQAGRQPAPLTPSAGKTLFITDLVFSNAAEESGPMRLRRDGETMLALELDNFRDLDFHFVTPIVVAQGQELDLWCQECNQAAVFYSGYERDQ